MLNNHAMLSRAFVNDWLTIFKLSVNEPKIFLHVLISTNLYVKHKKTIRFILYVFYRIVLFCSFFNCVNSLSLILYM